MSNTTILIRKQTRDGLKNIGRKSQTYNDLIEELIDHCYRCKQSNKKSVVQVQTEQTQTETSVDSYESREPVKKYF
jgi:hypothetical protein